MSEDAVELVGYIKCILDGIAHRLHGEGHGDGVWTGQIKQKLVDLGNAKGYYTCASSGQGYCLERAYHSEWLWDICWLDGQRKGENQDFPMVKRVPFACESEWGDKRKILEDFQKLLAADIGLGLMILQCWRDEQVQEYLDLCIEAKEIFCNYNGAERKLLLACYSNESGKFHYRYLRR